MEAAPTVSLDRYDPACFDVRSAARATPARWAMTSMEAPAKPRSSPIAMLVANTAARVRAIRGSSSWATRLGGAQAPIRVEGRFVSPVRVLDDEDRWARGTRHEVQNLEQQAQPIAVAKWAQQGRLGPGHVPERAERLRDDQVVAGSSSDVGIRCDRVDETCDQRALADACLAANKNDLPAGSIELGHEPPQYRQFLVPFQEHRFDHTRPGLGGVEHMLW
jgi:hypothetical protein